MYYPGASHYLWRRGGAFHTWKFEVKRVQWFCQRKLRALNVLKKNVVYLIMSKGTIRHLCCESVITSVAMSWGLAHSSTFRRGSVEMSFLKMK